MTKIVDAPAEIERQIWPGSGAVEQSEAEDASLIQVKQIPIIIEKLASVKEQVLERTSFAKDMACTEDNYKEIKRLRAALKNEFAGWEAQRKGVKEAVMSPYEQFETTYKDCIATPYKEADREFALKINSVEQALKDEKRAHVEAYFKEYAQSLGIVFVKFENVGCNITLTVTEKKLKEQVKVFLDRVNDDLGLISTQEHQTEILVEYKHSLNVSAAITSVKERYAAIEAEKARAETERAEREKAKQAYAQNLTEYEPFTANVPSEIAAPEGEEEPEQDRPSEPSNEQIFNLKFTIYGTKAQLKECASAIKEILNERGLRYE